MVTIGFPGISGRFIGEIAPRQSAMTFANIRFHKVNALSSGTTEPDQAQDTLNSQVATETFQSIVRHEANFSWMGGAKIRRGA
jgi:hypothetical protein